MVVAVVVAVAVGGRKGGKGVGGKGVGGGRGLGREEAIYPVKLSTQLPG